MFLSTCSMFLLYGCGDIRVIQFYYSRHFWIKLLPSNLTSLPLPPATFYWFISLLKSNCSRRVSASSAMWFSHILYKNIYLGIRSVHINTLCTRNLVKSFNWGKKTYFGPIFLDFILTRLYCKYWPQRDVDFAIDALKLRNFAF